MIKEKIELSSWKQLQEYILNNKTKIRVVSLDLFDTVLIRQIPAEDLVVKIAKKLSEEISFKLKYNIDYKKIITYREAFTAPIYKREANSEKEWLIDSFFNYLASKEGIDKMALNKLGLEIEYNAETAYTLPAEGIHSFINAIQANHQQLIITSDTNHSTVSLKKILGHFKIYYNGLFSSGSLEKSKRIGTVFPYIEQECKEKGEHFIHIGDNYKRDFIRPQA